MLTAECGFFEGPRPLLKTLTRLPDMLASILDGEMTADSEAELLDFGANQARKHSRTGRLEGELITFGCLRAMEIAH